MKTKIMMVGVAVTCFAVFTAQSEIPKRGDRHNITGKVTLQIIDDGGLPVKNAAVEMMFIYSDTRGGYETVMGESDTNGCFTAEGKSIGTLSYAVSKIGCYKTSGQYKFYQGENRSIENNHWLPWNPTVPVVLKPMKNPIPMYAKRVIIDIPEQNTPIGFDLERGDWVVPYGKGSVSDFNINYSTQQEAVHHYWKRMVLCVPNSDGGFLVKRLDEYSSFISSYDAPADGYMSEYLFEQKRTPEQKEIHKANLDNEYFVVRSRVVTNALGEIVSANYSKIYGPIQYALWRNQKYLEFIYYFNPTPNDRNLEFDPSRNLMPNPGRTPVNIP